mgnify:CR=1 FL=1
MVTSVSDNNKRIAKNTLLLYVRMVITMGIGIFTSRIVLQNLGVVDYGINNVVAGMVTMFTFLNSTLLLAHNDSSPLHLEKEILRRAR